jgi:hypothetical protein
MAAIALLVAGMLLGAYGRQPAVDGRAFRSPYPAGIGARHADTPMAHFHYVQADSDTR